EMRPHPNVSAVKQAGSLLRWLGDRLGVGREWWEVVQEQGDVLDVPSLLRHGPHCWLLCRPHSRTSLQPYSYVISEPLGRSAYKEQYLFVYRMGVVSVVDSYYYDDGCEPCGSDTFSREPFIVKFSSPYTEVQEFVLVPLHTPPSEAVAEIDALYDVYLDVINKWGTDNILFLGDFNADCSYVGPQDWPSIRLRTSNAFQWLIPDSADTTVSYTDCAYDRIVVSGSELQRCTVTTSAKVNNFQETFHLQREDVSEADSLPVCSQSN
uniref:Deoxyribonuclease 1 n=1 Tax=Chelydra serpentina TaxID=8475 RepID=A0A8C3RPT0_CHESE